MSFKKSTLAVLGSCALISAFAAQAEPLTIVNNTDNDSTSIINSGLCSTLFGSSGITKAHSTNVVSDKLIALACITNSSNCKADIYMTNNCTGPVVATAVFDTKAGIKSIQVNLPNYSFDAAGFKITIDENA